MPSDAIAASHSCRSSPGPQNQRMTRGEGRVCDFDRVHDLDPRLVELELGVELLCDFAAEEMPLEAVLLLRILVLVINPNRLEQCLAHALFQAFGVRGLGCGVWLGLRFGV